MSSSPPPIVSDDANLHHQTDAEIMSVSISRTDQIKDSANGIVPAEESNMEQNEIEPAEESKVEASDPVSESFATPVEEHAEISEVALPEPVAAKPQEINMQVERPVPPDRPSIPPPVQQVGASQVLTNSSLTMLASQPHPMAQQSIQIAQQLSQVHTVVIAEV